MKVSLADVVLVGIDPVVISSQENPFTLAAIFRFYYERLCFTIVELLPKRLAVTWQQPSRWKKLKVIRH